jgi:nitrogen-specific signal transduction histidine kinase
MKTSSKNRQPTKAGRSLGISEMLQAYWAKQPRAVRVFACDFEVLWDNTENREERYPVYRDAAGHVVSIPPAGKARNAWPVRRALTERRAVERNYWVTSEPPETSQYFRVRAWPLINDEEHRVLIVEEIEGIDATLCCDDRVRQLDMQLSDLICKVSDMIAKEFDPKFLRIRLENPNLQPCYEIKQCGQTACPAYQNTANLRCWEIPRTFCPNGVDQQKGLDKCFFCNQCEVFLMACPDPLTRVGENINRLFNLLEMNYQEALEAHERVQQAEKMTVIGELMLGIAHEIKNPLSIVMGRLDCLSLELESLSEDELAQDLEVIRSHSARVQSILEHVLTFTRPEPPVPQPLQINHVILETLPMVRKTLEGAKIRLTTNLSADLPLVHADPVQIQQVLLNLYLNARDAMPQGGDLVIASYVSNGEHGEIIVTVSDTGEGMNQEQLEKIFFPFYSTKAGAGGTGLGLAICRRIMRQHEGRIEAEISPNGGTTFRLAFPVRGIE